MTFLSAFTVLDFSAKAGEEYGRIRAELESLTAPINLMDVLIAGHAKSEELILVTNSTHEFELVKGLKLENWADEN